MLPGRCLEDCPICGGPLSSKIDRAASCTSSWRCFCDSDLEPIISGEVSTDGHVVETKPSLALFEGQLIAEGKTNTRPTHHEGLLRRSGYPRLRST
jgi:hypothetical protein